MKATAPTTLIADVQVLPSPTGTDANEFAHVEAAIAVIAGSGLKHHVHALGTTVEGPPDTVWAVARSAFDAALQSGAEKELMILKLYQGSATVASLEASGRAVAATAAAARPPPPPLGADTGPAPPAPPPREPRLIHSGSSTLPPLVEVPGRPLPLEAIVKPPDADTLWQWQQSRGLQDADSSWASIWPAAAGLAAYIAASPDVVAGKAVAELGAGLGIAGLVHACGRRTPHTTTSPKPDVDPVPTGIHPRTRPHLLPNPP